MRSATSQLPGRGPIDQKYDDDDGDDDDDDKNLSTLIDNTLN